MSSSSKKPNVKMKYDTSNHNLMVTTKCPLKKVIKNTPLLLTINETVLKVHKIVIQIYQFINLYLIHKYDNNEDFPKIDIKFIKHVIKTITTKKNKRGLAIKESSSGILHDLDDFYSNEYKEKCISDDDIIESSKLNYILAYDCIDIVTCIENNIKEHFLNYINKFVNISFDFNSELIKIDNNNHLSNEEKKERKKDIYFRLQKVKFDLIKSDDDYESERRYHRWLDIHKQNIINKTSFMKDSFYYDLAARPQDYLKSMFYINKQLERSNEDSEYPVKLYQVIPQRTSIIPKHICIDSCGLADLSLSKDIGDFLKNVSDNKDDLWRSNFKVNKKEFNRKHYTFDYIIRTDGVSCSILLTKLKNGKPIVITKKMQKNLKEQFKSEYKYIEDVDITKEMIRKKLITFDCGYDDLFYCIGKTTPCHTIVEDKKGNIIKEIKQDENLTFRYTQNQRRVETRKKKYNKLIDSINKETLLDDKTIKEYEAELSEFSSRSVDYEKYIGYCSKKNEINRILFEHYEKYIFRKLKLNGYTNTQKSESKMINNFQNKYGKPDECLLVIGDWSIKGNMKGKEPAISKRIRRIFKKQKYEIYQIDEFNTSKLCHNCCHECEGFLRRESHKPKDKNKETGERAIREVWGIRRCTNPECAMIHNRDKNACLNMYKIVQSIFKGKGRSIGYRREEK